MAWYWLAPVVFFSWLGLDILIVGMAVAWFTKVRREDWRRW